GAGRKNARAQREGSPDPSPPPPSASVPARSSTPRSGARAAGGVAPESSLDPPDPEGARLMEPLIIPEHLSGLSTDELAAQADEIRERLESLNDDKTLNELGPEAVTLIENAMAADDAIIAEQAKRDEAKAEQEQILAATRERLGEGPHPHH